MFEVFKICGQPSVGGRRKRHADAVGRSSRKTHSAPWPVDRGRARDHDSPDTLPNIGVADVVSKIRVSVNTTFGFWNRLSQNECSNITVLSSIDNAKCWNGTNLVRYVLSFTSSLASLIFRCIEVKQTVSWLCHFSLPVKSKLKHVLVLHNGSRYDAA